MSHQTPSSAAKDSTLSIATQNAEPYRYAEGEDRDVFDIPNTDCRSYIYKGLLILILLIAALCIAVFSLNGEPEPSATAAHRKEPLTPQQKLVVLIETQSYSEQELRKIQAELTSATKRNIELEECLSKLINGPHKSSGHPENTLYLLRHAQEQQLPAHQLMSYYLTAVTSTYNTQDWIQQNRHEEVFIHWKTLFRTYPHATQCLLQHARLKPYMQPLIEAATPI